MSTLTMPELDYIISPLTGRAFEFNQGGVRLLDVFGLGMPRMSSKEEIIRERSVFQHGSTAVMLKLPEVREWGMVMDLSGASSRQEYWDLRDILIRAFNPARSSFCNFDVPLPLQYTKVLPNGEKRKLDFFYRSGLFDSNRPSPDGRYERITVRLISPDVTLYSDEEEIDYDSSFYVSASGDIIGGNRRWIIDESVLSNQYENKGSWCGCPQLEFEINFNGDPSYILTGIVVRNVTRNITRTFRQLDYPSSSWPAFVSAGGNDTIIFDVCNRVLQRRDSSGAYTTDLELEAQEETDWSDFALTPDDEFVFGIDLDEPTNARLQNINFKFVPRYVGI